MSTVTDVLKQRKWRMCLLSTTVLVKKRLSVVVLQVNLLVALEKNIISIKIMSLGR